MRVDTSRGRPGFPRTGLAAAEHTAPGLIVLAPAETSWPPLEDSAVEVWRDVGGTVSAVGYRSDPDHCLFVPGIGTFRFVAGSATTSLIPLPTASEDAIDDAYHRIALPLFVQFKGSEVLHASAVLTELGVVALCGRSGAGKSTLAFALGRRGHDLYADDALAFELSDGQVLVRPLPFRMRLRPASASWFDAPAHLKGAERSTPWRRGSPAPFRALFVLDRRDSASGPGRVQVDRLDPADAFSAVLPHGYYVVLDDEAVTRRMVTTYLGLSDRLPVFDLRYVPGLDGLEEMVDRVERELAEL